MGATIAANDGATAHQLMALFWLGPLKEAERYTRGADQQRLARGAMHMLETAGEAANEGASANLLFTTAKHVKRKRRQRQRSGDCSNRYPSFDRSASDARHLLGEHHQGNGRQTDQHHRIKVRCRALPDCFAQHSKKAPIQ
jgi:hypothetical protein